MSAKQDKMSIKMQQLAIKKINSKLLFMTDHQRFKKITFIYKGPLPHLTQNIS